MISFVQNRNVKQSPLRSRKNSQEKSSQTTGKKTCQFTKTNVSHEPIILKFIALNEYEDCAA